MMNYLKLLKEIKMIDNPLPDQVMQEKEALYINEQFEEHCANTARKIAEYNNLHPDYYEPFIKFYIEECRESDRGYFFDSDKYIINIWWDHNKDLYDTKTPFIS